ncbi:uncharacterized protein PODANS_1_21130 [Podospora anserina S mat+]|uniref:Podospora anserina S mat+ genomic DNA chromosome 1, supercontig 5 n=1 Tax=Podospora anserina (strain S / ATCC MYA-4624 / DSM 980 / FGSC 10383) TaxID=515849 RepID=B2ABK3_PODAN|nr:uncharacterized protein PODANS_1_21130 [Podospora anserina S mat+]CAP60844.1 unnamed protein product [Podospora anserina S mat+]CDP24508.1 Putative protein similar to protein hob1 of Schizosaccharomyces pombe [Podospora anserina S mat+]
MQSMQRQFGKLLNKGPGDNAKVSVLLKDYEDADKVLATLIENARAWRDSWDSLINSQHNMVVEFEGLYDPIVGATDGHGREAAPTPQLQLERTLRLKETYGDLKTELLQEIVAIEERILRPATDARSYITPIRKTIKKRENKRLDYEKVQDKTLKLQRKPGRNAKEDASLAKCQDELSRVADEFNIADEHLRQTLPPIVEATFSIVPPLLAALVLIQNRLLGLYYTTLHNYCEDSNFPSPAPPMEDVIAVWNAACSPVQSQIEHISFIRHKGGYTQPPPSNGYRRTPSGLIPSTNSSSNSLQPRPMRIPSSHALKPPSPSRSPATTPPSSFSSRRPEWANPTEFTTASHLGGANIDRSKPARERSVSPNPAVGSIMVNGGLVVKKRPPPPPPPKKPALVQEQWVVALYPFAGQGQGDLSFDEGERIKVVTKTRTDQDWWVGELRGVRGSFPANYCRPA